jgi:hypothetical protein
MRELTTARQAAEQRAARSPQRPQPGPGQRGPRTALQEELARIAAAHRAWVEAQQEGRDLAPPSGAARPPGADPAR